MFRTVSLPMLLTLSGCGLITSWQESTSVQNGPVWTETATCPSGFTAVAGTARLHEHSDIPVSALVQSHSTDGGKAWTAEWTTVLGVPAELARPEGEAVVNAFCVANSAVNSCMHEVTGETGPLPEPMQQLILSCPVGSWFVGGGFELYGDHDGVVVDHAKPAGLLWPYGYIVTARVLDEGAHDDWGIRAQVWCAEEAAMGTMAASQGFVPVTPVPDPGGTDYAAFGVADAALSPSCDHPIGPGLMSLGSPPGNGAVQGMGYAADGTWGNRLHAFVPPGGTMPTQAFHRTMCTEDLQQFGLDLLTCGGDEPAIDPLDTEVPSIGATIVVGLVEGGGGIIVLPGGGGGPVDPEWMTFREVADALDIAIVKVPRAAAGAAGPVLQRQIREGLVEEGHEVQELTELSDALGQRGVSIVAPEDEQAAVAWLRANREAFRDLPSAFVLLMLDAEGEAVAEVERW